MVSSSVLEVKGCAVHETDFTSDTNYSFKHSPGPPSESQIYQENPQNSPKALFSQIIQAKEYRSNLVKGRDSWGKLQKVFEHGASNYALPEEV